MILDKSYFIGELDIPTNNDNVEPSLNYFIEKYEKHFLVGVLGYELYLLFIAAIEQDPIPTPYKELLQGDNYEFMGTIYHWEGFKETVVEPDPDVDPPIIGKYRSIIANYVYYRWMRDKDLQNVGIGVVKTKVENSVRVSVSSKAVRAMSELRIAMKSFIQYMDTKGLVFEKYNKRSSMRFIHDNIIGINEMNI